MFVTSEGFGMMHESTNEFEQVLFGVVLDSLGMPAVDDDPGDVLVFGRGLGDGVLNQISAPAGRALKNLGPIEFGRRRAFFPKLFDIVFRNAETLFRGRQFPLLFRRRVSTLQLHAVDERKPFPRVVAAGVHGASVDLVSQALGGSVLAAEDVSVRLGVEALFRVAVRVESQFDVSPKLGPELGNRQSHLVDEKLLTVGAKDFV